MLSRFDAVGADAESLYKGVTSIKHGTPKARKTTTEVAKVFWSCVLVIFGV
jgi:hypothetical protein